MIEGDSDRSKSQIFTIVTSVGGVVEEEGNLISITSLAMKR
jgi:hypothetical protein